MEGSGPCRPVDCGVGAGTGVGAGGGGSGVGTGGGGGGVGTGGELFMIPQTAPDFELCGASAESERAHLVF